MRLLLMFILSASVLFGQLKNKDLEVKFEKSVLKEIVFVKNEKEKGTKSNIQILEDVENIYTALDKNLRVLCRVRLDDISSKIKVVELGCEIKNETHNDIYVWIPTDKIEDVAELEEVLSIGSKGVAINRAEVISAGVGLHRTDLVYSTYGLTGNGVKVGVISNGMNYWQESSSNGDLPAFVYAVDGTNNSTNYPGSEGTAMMEIIHDIAPGTELWFGGFGNDDDYLDFADRITHLKQQGCKVIVDDVGLIVGYSYFQENEISTAIKQFVINSNGCYISSVGNQNGKMYTGTNYTIDTDDFLKFNGSTKELMFTANYSGQLRVTLQWADDWFTPDDDFDLYVYDNNNQLLISSTHRSTNFPPEEYVNINVTEGTTYKIKVKWYDYYFGESNREIKIALWGKDLNMPLASVEKQIFGHQITSEAIGAAATNVIDPLNVEDFSSRGPAIVYSSGSGTTNSIQQPKITAADNVETFVGQSGNFSNPFSGTSAAAPHLAGIAALYFEGFPTDSYSQFLSKIKNTSVIMSDGGSSSAWSNISGFGRVDAFSAIEDRIADDYVDVTVNQFNSLGTNVSTADIWQNNSWVNFAVPKTFIFPKNSNQVLRSNQSLVNNEKYHDWNNSLSNVTNHKSFTITTSTNTLDAFLLPTNNVQIKNNLEGSSLNGGTVGFKDPWLIDDSDSKGPKNRGTVTSALWYDNLNSPFSPSTTSDYKGIFFDQSGSINDWQPPYYTIRVPSRQTINIGGTDHTFYFQNWIASPIGDAEFQYPNSTETPVVFKNADVTINAVLKGTSLSNDEKNYENNSQRKIVRTPEGYLHRVYESMKNVWYEISRDNGVTWELMNNGKPLGITESKNPSIDYIEMDSGSHRVLIVFQQQYGESDSRIRLRAFKKYTENYIPAGALNVTTLTHGISYPSNPVVATFYAPPVGEKPEGPVVEPYFIVVYNSYGLYWSWGTINSDGLGLLMPTPEEISFHGSRYESLHPTLSSPKLSNNNNIYAHLAFENLYEGNIGYGTFTWQIGELKLDQDSYSIVSDGSGYKWNLSPSITINNSDNTPRVVWRGTNDYTPGGAQKTSSSELIKLGSKLIYRGKESEAEGGNWWKYIKIYGSDVLSPTINNDNYSDVGNESLTMAWAETKDEAVKCIQVINDPDHHVLTTPQLSGKYVQLSNGSNFDEMMGDVFKNRILPYSFDTKTTNVNPTKTTTTDLHKGREGIARYNDTEFYFMLADVLNGEESIEFERIVEPGSHFETLTDLNNYLQTEEFTLSETSPIFYSVLYGLVDTNDVANLSGDEFINFRVELVDSESNEVIGIYDNVTYDTDNLYDHKLVAYEINTEGAGSRDVFLRLVIDNNFDAEYTLAEAMNDDQIITKQGTKTISYAGSLEVKEYALSQNYPNPFNPTTNIMYQLPKEGRVTIKLYDILGREIQTLVDEHKSQGRYEFTFDGSKLSSGVYIYRITSGEFTASKKFILMK